MRPSSTACSIEVKLSSARTTSAASLVTSVPLMPMATPTSARRSAGASLTPSPVIATTSPRSCSDFTSRSLCSGEVRANTSWVCAISSSSSSEAFSSSDPVIDRSSSPSPSPSSRPMASAVPMWSPVIILTRIPALRQSSMDSMASGRGGSTMPTMPTSVKPSPGSSPSRESPSRTAAASTRRPSSLSSSMSSSHMSRSSSSLSSSVPCVLQSSSTRPGAPLRWTHLVPSPLPATTAMNLLSELNGISSERSYPEVTKLAFFASVMSAPSVGSPTSVHSPSSSVSSASLATAMVSTTARRSACSSRSTSPSSSVIEPSGA